jgi:hypothetical protein
MNHELRSGFAADFKQLTPQFFQANGLYIRAEHTPIHDS